MISLVIPVYRAKKTLPAVLSQAKTALWGHDYEVILVDDDSPDDSWDLILEEAAKDPHVRGLRLAYNVGQQRALVCGLLEAKGQVLLTMDDDGEHPIEGIFLLLEAMNKGHDLAFLVPERTQKSVLRRWGSKLTDRTFRWLLRKPRGLQISSFRAMRPSVVEGLATYPYQALYLSAALLERALRPVSIKRPYQGRHAGSSSYSFSRLVTLYGQLLLYHAPFFFLRPFRSKGPLYQVSERSF